MVYVTSCDVVLIHRDLLVGTRSPALQMERDLLDVLLEDVVVQDPLHGRCSPARSGPDVEATEVSRDKVVEEVDVLKFVLVLLKYVK